MLEFKNADVAAKYTSSFKGDPIVHVPAVKAKGDRPERPGIKKKLSQYTLAEADILFSMPGQNHLQLKAGYRPDQIKATLNEDKTNAKKTGPVT